MRDHHDACERCGRDFRETASIMSTFNHDIICLACKRDEREAPGYAAADEAEVTAVRQGIPNFPGVALSAVDRAFLAEKRQRRTAASPHGVACHP